MASYYTDHLQTNTDDILISSAIGGTRAIGPFLDMDIDGYKASFDKLWGYANIVLVSGAPPAEQKSG